MTDESTYCNFTKNLDKNNVHKIYHDTQYGFPLNSDNELFGRLILEINQAGLSWNTILNKQDNFRKAYSNFSIKVIANYDDKARTRLLNDAGIIRNKLKVDAVIYNAQILLDIQKKFGSFQSWLNNNHPKTKEEWVKLFKKTFKFTGGEITNEFLMSTGYLKGSHKKNCHIYKKILKKNPKWNTN
jgi:DNA-3-methyladenine glycosylase I